MLNAEKFLEEIKDVNYTFALKENKILKCDSFEGCDGCAFQGSCWLNRTKWLLEEYKEPILNDEEKEILNQLVVANSVISNKKLLYVQKVPVSNYSNKSFLLFRFEDSNCVYTARFKTDCIFKRMEGGKRYILEELGL